MLSTHVKMAAKVLISCGLIVFALRGVDIFSVFLQIMSASILNVTFAWVLMTGLALIHSERWRIVLVQLRMKLTYGDAIKLVFISYFFNQTLPSTVGGDAFRIWGAHRKGISLQDAVCSVIVDRIIALISILLMIFASSPWLSDLFGVTPRSWMLGLLLAVCAVSLSFLLLTNRLLDWLSRWRLGRGVISIVSCAKAVFLDIKVASYVVVLSVCSYFVVSFAVYLLARGMLVNLEFKYSLLLMPLVILVTILPVSIAGWGIREGAMLVSLDLVGVPSADAVSISILLGLVSLLSGLPGGLIWLVGNQRLNK